jgi:hypothetical protein
MSQSLASPHDDVSGRARVSPPHFAFFILHFSFFIRQAQRLRINRNLRNSFSRQYHLTSIGIDVMELLRSTRAVSPITQGALRDPGL